MYHEGGFNPFIAGAYCTGYSAEGVHGILGNIKLKNIIGIYTVF
jgi:hypothetical protein